MKQPEQSYTTRELLSNDSFLRWRLLAAKEDVQYWNQYMELFPEGKNELDQAIRIVQSLHFNDYQLSPDENLQILDKLQKRIHRKQSLRRLTLSFTLTAVASVILFLFLLPQHIKKTVKDPGDFIVVASPVIQDTKDIVIITGNNEQLVVEEKEASFTLDKEGNIHLSGEETLRHRSETQSLASWNKLVVPKGRRSSLVLPDGTCIWVNSGSVVEFPEAFRSEYREIRMEGEIYIEVMPDTSKPFLVHTPDLSVKVLGTSFNVSSYTDDLNSFVVLVDGRVEVSAGNETIRLLPDQMATLEKNIFRKEQVDVRNYISWKDGVLQFGSEPLSQVLNRLARYYDITVHCETAIQNQRSSGKLVLFDDPEEVLRTICNTLQLSYNYDSVGKEIHVYK